MVYTGGAERLIVDAAVELASHGHDVHIFTSHHDKNRCFEETLAGVLYCFFFNGFAIGNLSIDEKSFILFKKCEIERTYSSIFELNYVIKQYLLNYIIVSI